MTWSFLVVGVLLVAEMVMSGTKTWYNIAEAKRRKGYEAEREEFEDLMR